VGAASYQPRAMEGTVLHRVVREHFETFRAEIAAHTDGGGLPRFVEREFREFLTCGALSRGFARARWDSGPACAGAGPSRRSRLRRVNDREASARWGRARRGRLRPHSGTGRRVASRGEPAARPREAPRLGLGGSLPVLPAWLGSRKVYTAFALFPHPL